MEMPAVHMKIRLGMINTVAKRSPSSPRTEEIIGSPRNAALFTSVAYWRILLFSKGYMQ